MKKILFQFYLMLFFFILSEAALTQGKFPMDEVFLDDPNNPLAMIQSYFVLHCEEQPDAVKTPPKSLSKNIIWFEGDLVGKKFIFAVESDAKKMVLYPDRDFDGDFAEEKPIEGKIESIKPVSLFTEESGEEEQQGASFGIVDFEDAKKSKLEKIKFAIYAHIYGDGSGFGINLASMKLKTGKIKLGERSINFALLDGILDGIYDNVMYDPGGHAFDFIWIDWDNSGDAGDLPFYYEIQPLPPQIFCDGKYYSIKPAKDGTSVTFKAVSPELCTLSVNDPNSGLIALHNLSWVILTGSDKKWQVAEGEYIVYQTFIAKKDGDGKEWRIFTHEGPGDESCEFTLEKGDSHEIKFGQPLKLVTSTEGADKDYSIRMTIFGSNGEVYNAPFYVNGKAQTSVNFKIVDKSGKEIGAGKFTIGDYKQYSAIWEAPKDFKGDFKVEVQLGTCPFNIKQEEVWNSTN